MADYIKREAAIRVLLNDSPEQVGYSREDAADCIRYMDAAAESAGGGMMENVNCLRCRFRHEDNGNCTAVGGFCTAVPAAHCPLLRQYLDTGMTPEAFQSYVVFLQDLIGNQKASEALDRFRQLVKADKDGRLVVLPCQSGEHVFALLDNQTHV